ncbi:MAG: tetratricopeptide repeat protein, partial [Bacteroidales bacterium]
MFFTDIVMLVLSMAFCMSIRAGGMILILYLFGFFIFYELVKYYRAKTINLGNVGKKLGVIMLVAILTWFMSVVLWPYGLQNPVLNPVKAHILMSRFPITFREVFEGKVEWTDYMPWYYLIKYMLITFPLTVIAGLIFFAFYLPLLFRKLKSVEYLLLSFTVLFPVIYVVCFRPNIYSGWRQFLFLYPGVIILSASGITVIINHLRRKYLKGILIILLLFLSLHPLKFLLTCYRYAYMYYNPLTGGLKGANGNYETDYYFIGQREAAEWLNNYLEQKGIKDTVIVGSNFSAEWYFRKNYFVKNIYFRNEERSNYDWDFYLSTNRYILPSRLREGLWPPDDAIKVVYACGTPVCAVIKRKSKDSYYGYRALHENRLNDAEEFFYKALQECSDDEMIFYNFAITLNRKADSVRADSALQNCLIINPFFEPALMYAGIISESKRKYDEAEKYYKNLLGYNRKYFEAYVRLAEITEKKDIKKARSILRECLRINPVYKPAILKLAGTY